MAANSNNSIRLRLYFDYPPPSVSDCRMCWLLVDLNKCRVVADLESVIRDKFEISRKSILNLFIDNCYLPHTESIYVVRDNDRVSVNVESPDMTNGQCSTKDESKSRKKSRRHSEVEPEDNDVILESKKKKRKKKNDGRQKGETVPSPRLLEDEDSQKKRTKKKEMKEKIPKSSPVKTPSIPSGQHVNKTPRPKPVDINGKAKAKPASSSECSSSSSEEEEAAAPKLTSKVQNNIPKKASVAPTAPKVTPKAKPTSGKTPHAHSSSSSSDSSDEAQADAPAKLGGASTPAPKRASGDGNAPQRSTGAVTPASGVPASAAAGKAASSDSESEEEIKLVIKRPLVTKQGLAAQACMSARGRGRGRGLPRGRGGVNGGHPEGRVGRGYPLDYGEEERRHTPLPYANDSLTNHSVTLQNPVEPPPKKDYSTMTLLAAPPGVGQKIAFKLLELTENYTPEVSQYKEGKILNFDHATKQVELELLNSWQAAVEPGKFDLVYQNADGSESVEYAVSRGCSRVTEHWDSLLEPRLVI